MGLPDVREGQEPQVLVPIGCENSRKKLFGVSVSPAVKRV